MKKPTLEQLKAELDVIDWLMNPKNIPYCGDSSCIFATQDMKQECTQMVDGSALHVYEQLSWLLNAKIT